MNAEWQLVKLIEAYVENDKRRTDALIKTMEAQEHTWKTIQDLVTLYFPMLAKFFPAPIKK